MSQSQDPQQQPPSPDVSLPGRLGREGKPPPAPPEPPPAPDVGLAGVPWSGIALIMVWVAGEVCVYVAFFVVRAVAAGAYAPGDERGQKWLAITAFVFALPLRLAVGTFLIKATSDARLEDLGLRWRNAGRDALLGTAMALPLAAVVYGVNLGAEALMKLLPGGVVQDHTLTELARGGPTPREWAVWLLSALVAAPVWEEFLFRGLIQPWAIARPWAGAVLMGVATFLGLALRWDALGKAWDGGWLPTFVALLPALVAAAFVPVYLALTPRRSPVVAGIFATSVLFGFLHARIWPSPVPLTLLAIGIGWLRWRTGGLAGPIALHATFNLIAVVAILIEIELRQ